METRALEREVLRNSSRLTFAFIGNFVLIRFLRDRVHFAHSFYGRPLA